MKTHFTHKPVASSKTETKEYTPQKPFNYNKLNAILYAGSLVLSGAAMVAVVVVGRQK